MTTVINHKDTKAQETLSTSNLCLRGFVVIEFNPQIRKHETVTRFINIS